MMREEDSVVGAAQCCDAFERGGGGLGRAAEYRRWSPPRRLFPRRRASTIGRVDT